MALGTWLLDSDEGIKGQCQLEHDDVVRHWAGSTLTRFLHGDQGDYVGSIHRAASSYSEFPSATGFLEYRGADGALCELRRAQPAQPLEFRELLSATQITSQAGRSIGIGEPRAADLT
jgi:hypothetical protein